MSSSAMTFYVSNPRMKKVVSGHIYIIHVELAYESYLSLFYAYIRLYASMLQLPLSPIRQATPLGLGSCLPARGCIQREILRLPVAVFKEKLGI
jgi:hypothetical protein